MSCDGRFFPTLSTDLTLESDLLPPVSLLLPALVLCERLGLPLDEISVSDGKCATDIYRSDKRYFLAVERSFKRQGELTLADSGVDVTLDRARIFDTDFVLLPTRDLSLFNKRLAPRLLVKSQRADIFVVYEKTANTVRFFAHSLRLKKGVMPTSAYLLHAMFGAQDISTDTQNFRFEYRKGRSCLVCSI